MEGQGRGEQGNAGASQRRLARPRAALKRNMNMEWVIDRKPSVSAAGWKATRLGAARKGARRRSLWYIFRPSAVRAARTFWSRIPELEPLPNAISH